MKSIRHATTLLLFAIGFTLPTAGARELPPSWRTDAEVIWSNPTHISGIGYSTPDAMYLQTETVLVRSTDGENWTVVAEPTSADADPGQTRIFEIDDYKTVNHYSPDSPEGQYPDYGNYRKRMAVYHDGAWWTPSLRSTDGENWENSDFKLEAYRPLIPSPDPQGPSAQSFRSLYHLIFSDGVKLYLVNISQQLGRGGRFISYIVTSQYRLPDGTTGGYSLKTVSSLSSGISILNDAAYVIKSETVVPPYAAATAAILDDGLVLFSDGTATVARQQPGDPQPFRLDPLPVPGLEAIRSLAALGQTAVAASPSGALAHAVDGLDWELVAQLPADGSLRSGGGVFTYTTPTTLHLSADGKNWEPFSNSLPTEGARFTLSTGGWLAAEDTDDDGQPDRVWLRRADTSWQLIAEHLDVRSLQYLPEIDLALVTAVGADGEGLAFTHSGDEWRERPEFAKLIVAYGSSPDFLEHLDHYPTIAYAGGFLYSVMSRSYTSDALGDPRREPFNMPPWGHDPHLPPPNLIVFAPAVWSTGSQFLQIVSGKVLLSHPVPAYPFSGGFFRGDGWRGSDWFGWVKTKDFPWIFQYPTGWFYAAGPSADSCWLWDLERSIWFWTSQNYWPWVYNKELGWDWHPRYVWLE